jgi:hypothetical protein
MESSLNRNIFSTTSISPGFYFDEKSLTFWFDCIAPGRIGIRQDAGGGISPDWRFGIAYNNRAS